MTTSAPSHTIACRNVWKVFGRAPEKIIPAITPEQTRSQILNHTGHLVAVRDISFEVQAGETFVAMGLGAGVGLLMIGLLSMWELSMDTLSQVLVAVFFSILIAIPLGIASARSDTVQAWLRPALDFLQTILPFVYLVPVIMLFNVGRVPGLIASVLYALPPAIRLTDLGIRQVAPEAVEAAHAFGSTSRQTLFNVQLPLALPAILAGINQTIMLVLSMVIIAGLVGGAGLGLESVNGLARNETGRGIEAGLSIVILAMIIDRLTQAWAARRGS